MNKKQFFELMSNYVAKNRPEIHMEAINHISEEYPSYLNFLNLKDGDTEKFFYRNGIILQSRSYWGLN